MAFAVQECGVEGCGRLLYVQVTPGDQKIYCAKCGGVTLFRLRAEQGDGPDGNEETADEV